MTKWKFEGNCFVHLLSQFVTLVGETAEYTWIKIFILLKKLDRNMLECTYSAQYLAILKTGENDKLQWFIYTEKGTETCGDRHMYKQGYIARVNYSRVKKKQKKTDVH